jgi:hypothetical protein
MRPLRPRRGSRALDAAVAASSWHGDGGGVGEGLDTRRRRTCHGGSDGSGDACSGLRGRFGCATTVGCCTSAAAIGRGELPRVWGMRRCGGTAATWRVGRSSDDAGTSPGTTVVAAALCCTLSLAVAAATIRCGPTGPTHNAVFAPCGPTGSGPIERVKAVVPVLGMIFGRGKTSLRSRAGGATRRGAITRRGAMVAAVCVGGATVAVACGGGATVAVARGGGTFALAQLCPASISDQSSHMERHVGVIWGLR